MSENQPEKDVLSDMTDAEAEAVDWFMNEHMYRHQISNSIAGMSCNPGCRTQALARAVNRHVLEPRRAARDATTPPTGCPSCGQGDGLCEDCTEDGVFGHDMRLSPATPEVRDVE